MEDQERSYKEYSELLEQRNLIEKPPTTPRNDGENPGPSYTPSSPGATPPSPIASPRFSLSLSRDRSPSVSRERSPSLSYSFPLASSPSSSSPRSSLLQSSGLLSSSLSYTPTHIMSTQESIDFQYGSLQNVLPRGFNFDHYFLSPMGQHAAKRIMCVMNKDNKKILPAAMSKCF